MSLFSAMMQEVSDLREQLTAERAKNEGLRAALEMICGRMQCTDNLMSNPEIAEAALSSSPSPSPPDAPEDSRPSPTEREEAIREVVEAARLIDKTGNNAHALPYLLVELRSALFRLDASQADTTVTDA